MQFATVAVRGHLSHTAGHPLECASTRRPVRVKSALCRSGPPDQLPLPPASDCQSVRRKAGAHTGTVILLLQRSTTCGATPGGTASSNISERRSKAEAKATAGDGPVSYMQVIARGPL